MIAELFSMAQSITHGAIFPYSTAGTIVEEFCRLPLGYFQIASHGYRVMNDAAPISSVDIELRMLMEAIFLKYSYDFREYTGASQKRRVLHAMAEMGCATVSQLQSRVLHEPSAFSQLLQYLTSPVTEMFRDPTYYTGLREHVMPVRGTYP